MTRQLFKGILVQLPEWLTHQSAGSMPRMAEQQWAINQMNHQVSQQKVAVTYGKIPPYEQIETFLIGTVSFSKGELSDGEQRIRLEFLDLHKTAGVLFLLNTAQLHKFIGEILKQVQAWDIDNPWQEKNTVSVSSDAKGRVIH